MTTFIFEKYSRKSSEHLGASNTPDMTTFILKSMPKTKDSREKEELFGASNAPKMTTFISNKYD